MFVDVLLLESRATVRAKYLEPNGSTVRPNSRLVEFVDETNHSRHRFGYSVDTTVAVDKQNRRCGNCC